MFVFPREAEAIVNAPARAEVAIKIILATRFARRSLNLDLSSRFEHLSLETWICFSF
jgi:hypothetical protein